MFETQQRKKITWPKSFCLITFLFCVNNCFGQSEFVVNKWIENYYALSDKNTQWLSLNKIKRLYEWLDAIEASDSLGLTPQLYNTAAIRNTLKDFNFSDSILVKKTDKYITETLLTFVKHLQQGNIKLRYDEVSEDKDSLYLDLIIKSDPKETIEKTITRLDCKDYEYHDLKRYLNDSLDRKDTLKLKSLLLSMNYCRYIYANRKKEYILVNIPAAEAEYYRNNLLILKMKVVVGKTTSPTPAFASYITVIETYPTWNVPRSIAVNEILPKVKKDESYLEQNNFDVVDAEGQIIDDSDLKWKKYNEKNFPYYFRQSTGTGNALGVLKFNLKNPFSVFLHATSWQGAFEKDYRFLSHGCVRLEKPFELANEILRGDIDMDELEKGIAGTKTDRIKLTDKVPAFVIYQPVVVTNGKVNFLKDVYNLVK